MCPGLGGCTGDVSQFGAASINFITNFRDRSSCVEIVEDPLPLPFSDTFPAATFDFDKWSDVVRVASADFAQNEPSEPFSANFDSQGPDPEAQDDLVSFPMLLGGESNVSLSFYLQERFMPAGASIRFQYLNSGGTWTTIDEIVSEGLNSPWF